MQRLYKNSINWRYGIREKPQKQPVNVANSSFDEQLEALQTNFNSQINALQGRSVKLVYQVCEYCQGPHSGGECYANKVLTISEEIEQVEAINAASLGNAYNLN